ncbi:MAG: hypothetical protein L3J58_09190 [Emcibacter sp.]|nr:hypothetical protein [Emcibacter sp.]
MENYFLKIIQLFGHTASRILIISGNDAAFNVCLESCSEKLISHVNLEQTNAISLLKGYVQEESYDLVILDRLRDKSNKIPRDFPTFLRWENLGELIKKSLASHGQVICLADNKLNLRRPITCINSLFNALLRRNTSPFSRYYATQIKAIGCSHIKRFHLIPDIENFNHLISDNRRATLAFMRKSRGFTRAFPKNPKEWPKWLFVSLGVDSWLVPTHLFWGRK